MEGFGVASEQQKTVRLFLLVACVFMAATWSFSRPARLRVTGDPDDPVAVEWDSSIGTSYKVFWTPGAGEPWRRVGDYYATASIMRAQTRWASNGVRGFYAVSEIVPVSLAGDITSDTVWSAMSGPYVLTGMVSVLPGSRLRIEPGVRVDCMPGSGLTVTEGVLHISGSPDEPVRFGPASAGSWQGIRVVGAGGHIITISNAIIEQAETGLWLQGGTGIVDGVVVRGCVSSGVAVASFTGSILRSTLTDNRGLDGGGICARSARLLIGQCTIERNWASGYQEPAHGGGVFCDAQSYVVMQRTRLTHNMASPEGGGFYAAGGRSLIRNCLFARNDARWGSAAYFGPAAAQMEYCTIVENWGNAVFGEGTALNLLNSIVWGNGGERPIIFNGVAGSVLYCRLQEPWSGTGNSVGAPEFFLGTYELKKTSPCIDAALDIGSVQEDIEGRTRWDAPHVAGSVADIGASEYADDDRDGLADYWEKTIMGGIGIMDGVADVDDEGADGLLNYEEIDLGTDPFRADTDGDGLLDGAEVHQHDTDPTREDTDNDGATDAYEVQRGTDPNDPDETPPLPRPVLNEIMHRPEGIPAYYQFIELYNACDQQVPIGGYTIEVSQFGKVRFEIPIPAETVMGSTSYYLIGGPFVCSADGHIPDLVTNMELRLTGDHFGPVVQVTLKDDRGRVVDGLLYGRPDDGTANADGCSTPPEPATDTGFSIARAIDGHDSNQTSDWRSVSNCPSPRTSGSSPLFDPNDVDRDGLGILQEETLGTDPLNWDSDGDGLADGDEVQLGLNPARMDSDGDGLWDGDELAAGYNPRSNDTDRDGLWDGIELGLGLNPLSIDSDNDGRRDDLEDLDGDGFSNKAEQDYGSDPLRTESNPGGLPGGVAAGYWDRGAAGGIDYRVEQMVDHQLEDGRFVQDFKRETAMVFFNVHKPTPVFFMVIERAYGHKQYSFVGARLVSRGESYAIFAALIPRGGATITLVERLARSEGGKLTWPRLEVLAPVFLSMRAEGQVDTSDGEDEIFIPLNDDDDDGDHIPDLDDEDVSGLEDDMAYVEVSHLKRLPLQLWWDSSVVRLYENKSKKLSDRKGRGRIWSARVGACIPNAPYKGWDDGKLYVEGVRPGSTWLTVGAGGFLRRLKITVVDTSMATDYDHDRDVDTNDYVRAKNGEPFRFWINDDDDEDAVTGDDIPGRAHADHEDDRVDSERDLVDFFPVVISIPEQLEGCNLNGLTFKLMHGLGGLNYLETDLTADNVGDYLVDVDKAVALGSRTVRALGIPGGQTLSASFLSRLSSEGSAVLLVEGCDDVTSPMWLEVVAPNGRVISSNSLALSISGVEAMYSHINLRPSGGLPDTVGIPTNLPNSTSGKNVMFVHGFSCNGEEARGWHAEIFKRLYWSGSKARFWGVTWQGDLGLVDGLHYQEDVANSFRVATNLSARVGAIPGPKVLLAHSLGNMVVSSAIQDHGLSVSKYCMLNAAVAMECYWPAAFSDSTNGNYMLHEDWLGYSNRTWCSKWPELFSLPDDRERLTWKDRFPAVLSVAYNFYSSGDAVFEIYSNGTPSPFTGVRFPFHAERYAWQKQEMFKGRGVLGGTDWAGWGFSGTYTMWEANAATEESLITNAVFTQDPDGMFSPTIAAQLQNEIIAMGVPALSSAAGANAITPPGWGRNYDANDHKPNGWGRDHDVYHDRWLHSDLKDMAYLYTYDLFNEVASQGDLQ